MSTLERQKEVRWLLEQKYYGQITEAAKRDIERLEVGEPLDYVIGFVEFLGCRIDLSYKPLIPRAETEEWVKRAIHDMKRRKGPMTCLDIFAGSGCVGVAVLAHVPHAVMDFAEREARLLPQIALNVHNNGIPADRFHLIQSDVFAGMPHRYYDYILANPPYVAVSRIKDVQESVITYEPHEAVFAGDDGLLYITPFLNQVAHYMKPKGKLFLEFDSFQRPAIEAQLSAQGRKHRFYKDAFHALRYVIVNY